MMIIIAEFDKRFTIGLDWFESVKGIRLGWIAIHIVRGHSEKWLRG